MSNAEKMALNVEGLFWTRQDEMVAELESLDYEVCEVNSEYVAVTDLQDMDLCFILYLGHANSTMWVESVNEM